MKKRVRILVSLLVISGSLTLTNKSYAESETLDFLDDVNVEIASKMATFCLGGFFPVIGGMNLTSKGSMSILAANRFYKLGAKSARGLQSILMLIGGSWALACWNHFDAAFQVIAATIYANEIVENPDLAMGNEDFRLLVESVGYKTAFSLIERIAKGEDLETVANSLSSVLNQILNTEDGFLDSGNEEDIEAQ